ncbi:MAG: porin [Armatimonadetes bacterium]|nr:porin [Armatimonadota bacterium]
MRWYMVAVLGVLVASISFAAAQGAATSVEALQAEIARLKEQLAKLEAKLAEIQSGQKAVERVTKRFEPIVIGGYIQMRYERDSSRPTDEKNLETGRAKENFRLRRVRLDVRGAPIKGLLYRLQVDASETDVSLRDAYLELQSGDGIFTFGHFKVPLLEEVLESSAVRWTPERARVSTALFPGERDRGIAYTLRKSGVPEITFGLFSGTRARQTQDSLTTRKSWLLRLAQPLGKDGKLGRIWIGRMDGIGRRDFDKGDIRNFDRERTAIGLLFTPISGLTIRGEWVDGKDAGTAANPTVKVRGWYALLGYKLPNLPITLYAKHDQYDPNRGERGNTFKRTALGIQYDLNRTTRFNLTFEDESNPSATRWTFQTQVRY